MAGGEVVPVERDQVRNSWVDGGRTRSSFSAIQVQRDVIIFENTRFAYLVQKQVCDSVIFAPGIDTRWRFSSESRGPTKSCIRREFVHMVMCVSRYCQGAQEFSFELAW